MAQAWVSGDPLHGAYVDAWTKKHPKEVAQWIKDNAGTPEPKNTDLAVIFFEDFSKNNPGMFPSAVDEPQPDGKTLPATNSRSRGLICHLNPATVLPRALTGAACRGRLSIST